MGQVGFGLTRLGQRGQLDALLEELPAVRPTTAELITRNYYQTEYGIYDHAKARGDRPLALVALHDKEDVVEGGMLFTYVRAFFNYRLHQRGLSLNEFLELPYHVVELILDIAREEENQDHKRQEDMKKQMENMK